MKKQIIFLIIGIFLIGIVIAGLSISNLILDRENAKALKRVGEGIGNIEKTREICVGEEDKLICHNETYQDKVKLLEQGCDDNYCYFKLYQERGINKDFKIKIEGLTNEEIETLADERMEEILTDIAQVQIQREIKSKEKRFDDKEISVSSK